MYYFYWCIVLFQFTELFFLPSTSIWAGGSTGSWNGKYFLLCPFFWRLIMGRNSSNALMELRIALQFVQKLFSVACKGLTGYLAARYMKCIVPYSSPEKLQYKHIDPFFSQELKKSRSAMLKSLLFTTSTFLMQMNENYMLLLLGTHDLFRAVQTVFGKHNYYEIKKWYLMACPLNEQIPRGPTRTFIREKVRKREVRSGRYKKKKTEP